MSIYIPPIQTDCCVDLSHSNSIPDPVAAFAAAKASGVELIIQKATQGTSFVDPTFAPRRKAAAQVGLLFGAYHFCDGSDPVAQTNHFLATVGDTTGIGLALDAEKNDASQVTIPQVITMARTIGQQVSRKLDLLYMGRDGPDGAGTGMTAEAMAELAGLVSSLWLPEYGSKPVCPLGFSEWVLHQYTGDGINGSGLVAGIGSGLDRSHFAGAVDDLHAWFAKIIGSRASVAPPPPPPPPPIALGSRVLRMGMTGDDVAALQAKLGVSPADGKFGPHTKAAVEAFQQAHGLIDDGVAGPATLAALVARTA